jgi:hypothetical protein
VLVAIIESGDIGRAASSPFVVMAICCCVQSSFAAGGDGVSMGSEVAWTRAQLESTAAIRATPQKRAMEFRLDGLVIGVST